MSSDLRTNLRCPVAQQVLDTKTPAQTHEKAATGIDAITDHIFAFVLSGTLSARSPPTVSHFDP
eukprot:scaffold95462_cov45-Attheya_sp.AAC.2